MSKPLATTPQGKGRQRRRRSSTNGAARRSVRTFDYHSFHNPYPPLAPLSQDRLMALHTTALRVLEDIGIKILLPEARRIFANSGAKIQDDMVFIGRDMVDAAEKLITDVEMLQIMVESLSKVNASDDDLGFGAIAQVQPSHWRITKLCCTKNRRKWG